MKIPLTFGDFAKTVKPIPNVALGTVVQISAVGVFKGLLSCTVVTFDTHDYAYADQIGPYPERAFQFVEHGSSDELYDLVQWLRKKESI
jgi:hypothetical protein